MLSRKCQQCAERATFHITEVEPDGYHEVHLCQKCVQKYLLDSEESGTALVNPTTGAELVAASIEHLKSTAQCPACGLSFEEFRNSGRLGCPNDYEVFREELKPLLENIHGALTHIGKVPRRLPPDSRRQSQLIRLRQELQQAVAVEDYELAAKLRDQIESLHEQP